MDEIVSKELPSTEFHRLCNLIEGIVYDEVTNDLSMKRVCEEWLENNKSITRLLSGHVSAITKKRNIYGNKLTPEYFNKLKEQKMHFVEITRTRVITRPFTFDYKEEINRINFSDDTVEHKLENPYRQVLIWHVMAVAFERDKIGYKLPASFLKQFENKYVYTVIFLDKETGNGVPAYGFFWYNKKMNKILYSDRKKEDVIKALALDASHQALCWHVIAMDKKKKQK